MSNIEVLYVGNDTVLEVAALKNVLTGHDLNAATVTVQLKDSAGADVAGEAWPKTMDYVTDSDGIYRATLPYTLGLTAGGRYVATIIADAGIGLRAEWFVECVARNRG